MQNKIILSVIIPSYTEEENLRIILPRVKDELDKINTSYEILVIDTMQSMDHTKEVCEKLKVTYINRLNNNNYGDAVRTGIHFAKGEYILFMDADGSHSPEFIYKLFEHKDNYDVVIASRYSSGGSTDNNKFLIFLSLLVNIIYSIVLGLKCKDVSNSFKLYRASLLKELNIYSKNFDIIEEILFKLKKKTKELRLLEVPFIFKERMFGHSKRNLFLFSLSYLITLIKLRFSK